MKDVVEMSRKAAPKIVKCRYPKCNKLHETTEILKEDAIQHGKSYYHADCLHIMLTVTEIRDLFYKNINQLMTGKQIGMLVATINNIVLEKGVDVDFLKFAVEYFIKYKPGKLQYPAGLYYVVQDKDVKNAWERWQERKLREEIKEAEEKRKLEDSNNNNDIDLNLPDIFIKINNNKKTKFSSVLGV